eukprot:m.18564 g.18564  ORF g.18564 m.18564 type:complete len:1175 (-) comp4979_c0_seq1:82-3606(-)
MDFDAQSLVEKSAQFWIDEFNLTFYQGILSTVGVLISLAVLVGYLVLLRQQAIFKEKIKVQQKEEDVHIRKRDIFRHWVKGGLGMKNKRKKPHLPRVKRRLYEMAVGRHSRSNPSKVKSTAKSLLEPLSENESIHKDVRDTLRSMRMFGHFEDDAFQELFKVIEIETRDKGQYLFRKGDDDAAIFIVQEGAIELLCVDPKISTQTSLEGMSVTLFHNGETITSILNFIGSMCGQQPKHDTMEARATMDDTVIIKISYERFNTFFKIHHNAYRQFIQVACTSLQRATFVALRRFMGLSSDLINTPSNADDQLVAHPTITNADLEDKSRYVEKLKIVCEKMAELVGYAEMAELLAKVAKFSSHKKGDLIFCQGEREPDLYYVVQGKLSLFVPGATGKNDDVAITICGGHFAGELATLSRIESAISAVAETDCLLVRIPSAAVQSFLWQNEGRVFIDYLLRVVIISMSPLVRQVDYAFDWHYVEAGCVVYTQDDPSNDVYIVLSGRLRSVVTTSNGSKSLVREYGRFDVAGEVEVLTETPRATSVHAVRDSELVKLPAGMLEVIKLKYIHVSTHLMKLVSKRLLSIVQGRSENQDGLCGFSTVALLPVSPNVPVTRFAEKLSEALRLYGSVKHLTHDIVASEFGQDLSNSSNLASTQLIAYLSNVEDRHSLVIYEADTTFTEWTRRCIRQADCVLVVALGNDSPNCTPFEKEIEMLAGRTQKELVLLHPSNTVCPSDTAQWLNLRSWCTTHHHIRTCEYVLKPAEEKRGDGFFDRLLDTSQLPNDVFDALTEKVEDSVDPDEELDEDVFGPEEPAVSARKTSCQPTKNIARTHYGRLARHLKGLSIGVVLGGGGAKGLSHAGFLRAMEGSGVPIDIIGGTSIGGFVSALYSEEDGVKKTEFMKRLRHSAKQLGNQWNMVSDLTYPSVAMFTGRGFNRVIRGTFEDIQLEDLWIPCFCVSTDITDSKKKVHTQGSCWRYIRASMSLSGYLPPICDPEDGHMLLDGGYVDILPIDVMRKRGACTIFANEVSSKNETNLMVFGDELSGWWLLWRRLNPFLSVPKIPDMGDIASRLSFISATNFLNQLEKADDDIELFNPPVTKYGVLDWDKIDDILKVGEDFSRHRIKEFKKQWDRDLARIQKGDVGRTQNLRPVAKHRSRLGSISDIRHLKYELDTANK